MVVLYLQCDVSLFLEPFIVQQVKVFAPTLSQFTQSKVLTEFPVQMAFSSVIKPQPNILKIESLVGLVVYCRLDKFSCNVTVSGYYHNKTLGKRKISC